MSNAPVSALAATPISLAGFMINDVVGFGILSVIAGVGLIIAARSRWARRSNDNQLGLN